MAEGLTVLIANIGQLDNLLPCLRSLFATSADTPLRVIVGFNFAGESDAPRALAAEFPQVEQLRAPARLGYCRAYNELMARSGSRYVLVLDDDTVLRPGTIDGMMRFMDAHPEVGIAGCRVINPDGSYQKSTGLMYSMATEAINVVWSAAFWRDGIDASVTTWRTVGWIYGNFMLVRAAVIQEVGGLDERFYTSQCEADWCLRISRAGWKVAYVPDFELVHIGGTVSGPPTLRVRSNKNLMRNFINRYYFMRKHYGDAALHAFRVVMSLGAALRLVKYSTLWLFHPGRRTEAGPKVRAYWSIALLGAAARPERLPEFLRHENDEAGRFRLERSMPSPSGATL